MQKYMPTEAIPSAFFVVLIKMHIFLAFFACFAHNFWKMGILLIKTTKTVKKETRMDILKKIFPLSFKFHGDTNKLVTGILIYVILGILIGSVGVGLLTALIPIPLIDWLLGTIATLVGVYTVFGIIIEVLVQCKLLK